MRGEEGFEIFLRLRVAESAERTGDRAEGGWNLLIQIGPVIFHCRPCIPPRRRIVEKAGQVSGEILRSHCAAECVVDRLLHELWIAEVGQRVQIAPLEIRRLALLIPRSEAIEERRVTVASRDIQGREGDGGIDRSGIAQESLSDLPRSGEDWLIAADFDGGRGA